MRLHEINNNKIHEIMQKYFNCDRFNITPDGIEVIGNCAYEYKRMDNPSGKMPKIMPIKFSSVSGDFSIAYQDVVSLKNSPKIIHGDFIAAYTKITSLQYGPKEVRGSYYCEGTPLTSLDGLPERISYNINLTFHKSLPLLKLLFVKDLKRINLEPTSDPKVKEIKNILTKYIGTGQKGALQCAAELTKAGFKNNARM